MSYPVYTMPSTDSRVKIYINGKPLSSHHAPSKHSKYINFVGELVPSVKENHETNTFDINLEKFVLEVLKKHKKSRKKKTENLDKN